MESYPLSHTMPNGATVSDWLGTVRVAAEVAVARIERVRHESTNDVLYELDDAEAKLVQALEELRIVRRECGRPAGVQIVPAVTDLGRYIEVVSEES